MNIWVEGRIIDAKRVLEKYPTIPYEVAVYAIKDHLGHLKADRFYSTCFKDAAERAVNKYQEIASAHARLSCVPLRDHLEEVKVIWSYDNGKVMEETTLWAPIKLTLTETDLRIAGTVRLLEEGVGMREIDSLEVVLNQ